MKEKHLRVWVRTGAALADFRINKLEEVRRVMVTALSPTDSCCSVAKAKRFLLNRLDRLETMKME